MPVFGLLMPKRGIKDVPREILRPAEARGDGEQNGAGDGCASQLSRALCCQLLGVSFGLWETSRTWLDIPK